MQVKPERIKCSWWFLGFKWILALTAIHGFVWKWDQWLLNPQKQKSLLHIAGWSCIFPVGVCEVFDCASTEHGSCPVLPAPMSKISQRAEGHPRLNLDGSVANYRLLCEIWVAPPWPGSVGRARCGLGAGARLPRSWQVLTPVPGSSMVLSNTCFRNPKFLHVAIGKGRIYFPW